MAAETDGSGTQSTSSSEKRVLRGGQRGGQYRKPSERDWSEAKEAHFLTILGETCNVTLACGEAGIAVGSAYARRRKVAAFRKAWGEAIALAYQRLELELLRRAFDGTEKVTTRRDGSEERVKEVSNQLGLQLLKLHRDTAMDADRDYAPEEVAEIRARLLNKLERLRLRDFAGENEGQDEGDQRIEPTA